MARAGSLSIIYDDSADAAKLTLSLDRENVANKLCAGKPITEAQSLIGQTYTLCRYAQQSAAAMALHQQLPTPAQTQSIQLEIIEQTLWRWLLDFPKLLFQQDHLLEYAALRKQIVRWQKALIANDDPKALPTPSDYSELSVGICQRLSIQPLSSETLTAEKCLNWLAQSDGLAASVLRAAAQWPDEYSEPAVLHSEELCRQAERYCAGELPLFGVTSAYVELRHSPLFEQLKGSLNELQLSLLARLLLLVETLSSLDAGQSNLRHGQYASGNTSISWLMTARGLLIHQVMFSDSGRDTVERYQVTAPTDLNFGDLDVSRIFLLQKTDLMQGRFTARTLEFAVLTLDPCVDYHIEVTHA